MTTFANLSTNLPPLILLAGGKSERMGCPKGLLVYENKAWLWHQLDAFRRAGGKRAVVVLGYNAEAYLQALPQLNVAEKMFRGSLEISTVINPLPQFGPFSSIQTGLSVLLAEGHEQLFFMGVDRPAPYPETWHKLSESLTGTIKIAYPVHEDKNGHPVLLSRSFAKHILTLPPEKMRMDMLRDSLPASESFLLPCSDSLSVCNINTPLDWAEFKNRPDKLKFPEITALTGKKRSGKTTCLQEIALKLKSAGFKTGGILQPASDGTEKPECYFVQDIVTQEKRLLAKRLPSLNKDGFCFDFYNEAWLWAAEKIDKARRTCDILIVDEVGRMESVGKGHLPVLLKDCSSETAFCWILCIRDDCLPSLEKTIPPITAIRHI